MSAEIEEAIENFKKKLKKYKNQSKMILDREIRLWRKEKAKMRRREDDAAVAALAAEESFNDRLDELKIPT